MKTLILTLALAAAGVSSARAQYYSPNVRQGAVLGGIAGAFIGGHSNDRWSEGAAVGAAAGALLGAVADRSWYSQPAAYAGSRDVGYDSCVDYSQPRRVVVVENPPVRYVRMAPVPRVVYTQRYAPRYAPRAPIVVVRPDESHRRQTVVDSRSRDRRRD
ncbi:MAG: 17 kDa surface antigen [Verrucomicrobia bacterium]|nr:17 kDa surface antigen [Verrucomicrobiota bacterium]